MDWLTGRGSDPEKRPEANPAAADAESLGEEVVPLVNQASGASWYEEYTKPVDVAVVRLCRLRRALHRLGYVCKRPTWSLKRQSTEQAGWVKNA